MRKLMLAAFLFCLIQAYGKEKDAIPEALMNAKNAFVVNQGSLPKDFEKLNKVLKEWGRFELVSDPKGADIIIALSSQSQVKTVQMPSTAGGLGGVNSQQVMISYIRITSTNDGTLLYSAETTESGDPKQLVVNLKNRMKKK